MERFRPGIAEEAFARQVVRAVYPGASSSYTNAGAIVFDEATDVVLGRACEGAWAVEHAWQDAAQNIRQQPAVAQ